MMQERRLSRPVKALLAAVPCALFTLLCLWNAYCDVYSRSGQATGVFLIVITSVFLIAVTDFMWG